MKPAASDSLARLDHVRRELALAKDLPDVKRLRDQAAAVKAYAQAQRLGTEVRSRAAEIVLLAERRAGVLLAGMGEKRGRPEKKAHGGLFSPKLAALGVDRKESQRWQAIARVEEPRFEGYLAARRDAGEVPTRGELLRIAKREANVAQHAAAPAPTATVDSLAKLAGQTFGTIYADPPWSYGNQGTRAATDNHYSTMTVDEIAALPVASLAAENAHLHLWTTNAFLFDALRVIASWGFTYASSCFVWVKPQMGLGNYWRIAHEFLLLGRRGAAPFADQGLMSWAALDRTKHSRKPDEVRRMVERASPGPRLELFGRGLTDGWTVWGNEADRAWATEASEVAP